MRWQYSNSKRHWLTQFKGILRWLPTWMLTLRLGKDCQKNRRVGVSGRREAKVLGKRGNRSIHLTEIANHWHCASPRVSADCVVSRVIGKQSALDAHPWAHRRLPSRKQPTWWFQRPKFQMMMLTVFWSRICPIAQCPCPMPIRCLSMMSNMPMSMNVWCVCLIKGIIRGIIRGISCQGRFYKRVSNRLHELLQKPSPSGPARCPDDTNDLSNPSHVTMPERAMYHTEVPSMSERIAPPVPKCSNKVLEAQNSCETAMFATTKTVGILDLGASQTVMGQHQVAEFLASLPDQARQMVFEQPAQMTFRFGNNSVVPCHKAIFVPVDKYWIKIAVVETKHHSLSPTMCAEVWVRWLILANKLFSFVILGSRCHWCCQGKSCFFWTSANSLHRSLRFPWSEHPSSAKRMKLCWSVRVLRVTLKIPRKACPWMWTVKWIQRGHRVHHVSQLAPGKTPKFLIIHRSFWPQATSVFELWFEVVSSCW